MRLAELSYVEAEENTFPSQSGSPRALEEYKKRTIQCLIAADYNESRCIHNRNLATINWI